MPTLSQADKQAKVSQNEARRRKEVALAEKNELNVARIRGELVPAAEVVSHWVAVATRFRDAVLSIPDKCSPALAAAEDAKAVRTILQAECESILRTLSDDLSAN